MVTWKRRPGWLVGCWLRRDNRSAPTYSSKSCFALLEKRCYVEAQSFLKDEVYVISIETLLLLERSEGCITFNNLLRRNPPSLHRQLFNSAFLWNESFNPNVFGCGWIRIYRIIDFAVKRPFYSLWPFFSYSLVVYNISGCLLCGDLSIESSRTLYVVQYIR